MNACRVILVGMMGSGKSTIGRLLSEATGWPYVDNDELVLRSHGATPRELLSEQGEAVMREAESSALALGLEVPAPAIIGVAAGTILDPANRDRLREWRRRRLVARRCRCARGAGNWRGASAVDRHRRRFMDA